MIQKFVTTLALYAGLAGCHYQVKSCPDDARLGVSICDVAGKSVEDIVKREVAKRCPPLPVLNGDSWRMSDRSPWQCEKEVGRYVNDHLTHTYNIDGSGKILSPKPLPERYTSF